MDAAPDDVTARPSRRRFFAMGAGAVGATALGAVATGAVLEAQPPRGGGRTSPLPAGRTPGSDVAMTWQDPLLRLVRRVTMGLTPADVALARQKGFSGYLDYQLRPEAIDDSALETTLATRLPMLAMTAATLRTQDGTELAEQLTDATWYRAAFSKAQLRERMVEFWTDHFNISINKVGYLKLVDDREVIRPNALGNYATLLRASARSGAMLFYLDQTSSRTPTPNQNYAREIMELHTLGVDNGYTQTDVAELSRILTGWSMDGNGAFRYIRSYHDRNAKTFLGQSFPAMAATATDAQLMAEGDTAINLLINHPSTAKYVSWKMARFLLAYEPPASVVTATAAAFTRTGGDIKTMIRTILTSANLAAAPAKFKRPFHLAISGLRALGTDTTQVSNIRSIKQRADQMGMPLFEWEQPNGYPEEVAWWSGLVVTRWSYTQALSVMNSATTARFDLAPFRVPDTADGVVNQIKARLFAGEMPSALRSALSTYLRGGTYNETRIRETLSLALAANEFQWF
jgi:uncharacterized protein (DUF1800 family)